MSDQLSAEERFLDLCDHLAGENGFFAKVKRRNAAKKEWRAFSVTVRRDVLAMSSAILEGQRASREARDATESNWRIIAQLPRQSRIRRLKYLDRAETAILDSVGACKHAIRAIDLVHNSLKPMFRKSNSTLLPLLESRRKQADTSLAEEEQALRRLQHDLHALKRRTPGRKVQHPTTREELEATWRNRIDRPPTIARFHPVRRDPPASKWHCRDLGSDLGAINRGVHILVGTDEGGRIVDRKVRKTVLMENSWDWCGDLPKEHVTHVALSRLPDARFVLQVENWPETRDSDFWILYLEFAPHGDLWQLAHNHWAANRWVPEEFLWLLFQALVESMLLMKQGSLASAQSSPSWQEIVHRDLKPENIVLGLPVKGHFQMYPRPKLTDFGGAIFTSKNDPINPDFYANFGTPGLTPPEQRSYVDAINGKAIDRFPVLSPSDVWGIGATMFNMMTLQSMNPMTQPPFSVPALPHIPRPGPSRSSNQPARDFDAMDIDGLSDLGYDTPDEDRPIDDEELWSDRFRYTLRAAVKQRYDAELCDMVNECMNFDPASRPPIEELNAWLDEQFLRRPRLRHLNSGRRTVGRAPEPVLCQPEKEEYKLGMHWQTLRVTN